jgi:SAM-dependent methyltransferase
LSDVSTTKPYEALGIIYDALGHHDYVAWGGYLAELLKDLGVMPGSRLIDAACGTGGITLELYKAGYAVLGMDVSQQMLTAAAAKAAKAGAAITFVHQDIRSMRVHRPIDGIICSCDGVNYLLSKADLLSFLRNARKSLKKGGILLFDVSSEEKLRAMDGQLYGEENEESAYLWTNSIDEESGIITMDITLFIKQWEFYRREQEVHRQKIWTAQELVDALCQSGYEPVGVYGEFTREPPAAGCNRIQFSAAAI